LVFLFMEVAGADYASPPRRTLSGRFCPTTSLKWLLLRGIVSTFSSLEHRIHAVHTIQRIIASF
jgi:hypothetical protein